MEIIGFAAAIIMGITLGLIGGGGSILTVPIMVYLFGITPEIAVAYSLFVVGITSGVGAFSHFTKGNIDIRTGLVFGAPSIVTVYIMRKFIVRMVPDPVFVIGDYTVSRPVLILVLFAALMLMASVTMISSSLKEPQETRKRNYPLIFGEGLVIGVITGSVGAGGGFLIIPALIFLAGLTMKEAIGTSLMIIAVNSLVGFTGDLSTGMAIDYPFIMIFTTLAIMGALVGSGLTSRISGDRLKPAFGWFVLAMGLFILTRELLLPH